MSGGAQAPLWLTIMLGVLAVVGTVGGAWGGQLIAGRNEAKRWRRERDREAQAYWREKRLDAYSSIAAHLNAVTSDMYDHLDGGGDDYLPIDVLERVRKARDEWATIEMIGSDRVVHMSDLVISDLHALAATFNHPLWGGPDKRGESRKNEIKKIGGQVALLQVQFRRDLAVSRPPGD